MSSFDPDPPGGANAGAFVHHPINGQDADEPPAKFVHLRVGRSSEQDVVSEKVAPEQVREQAYAEGLEAGRAELPWQEAEELSGVIETLEGALSEVAELRLNTLRDQRVAVVGMAIEIAEKLVRHSIETDPDQLATIVERAIATLPDEGKLCVAISNDDYQVLQSGLAQTLATFGQDSGVEISASDDLLRGDVRVYGECGDVDARVSSLMARVRESLADLYDIAESPS